MKGKKMKKVMKLMLGAAAVMAAGSLAAQTTTFNKAADWKKNKLVSDGDGVLNVACVSSQAMLTAAKRIDIDPSKTYTLKFSVRAPDAVTEPFSLILGGFAVYDKNGRAVSCIHSGVIANTQTEVAAGAKKGDTVLTVKDASNIKASPEYGIVAGAKQDLSDLPNRDILSVGLKKVEKDGDVWKITLIRPLARNVKAGTSVRIHLNGGYVYTAGVKYVGKDWVTMSGKIKGIEVGSWGRNVWPAGTAKAEFIILANWNTQKTPVQIKDVSLVIE